MALPIELTSRVGVSKHNISHGFCRKWFTPIAAEATIHPNKNKPPIKVGEALGFIIKRSAIQSEFYEEMEAPDNETMDLALELFDRYGRIKEEICEHALRKGSGVWKSELNDGSILLIKDVKVESQYRRKRVGSKLVLHILEEAMRKSPDVAYAFASTAIYNDDRTSPAISVDGVASFLRTLQFRRVGLTPWLALARDKEHPSRRLPAAEDPDLQPEIDSILDSDSDPEVIVCNPDFTQTRLKQSEWDTRFTGKPAKKKPSITTRNRPLHYAVKSLTDMDALNFLRSHARGGDSDKFSLKSIDGRGDSVLHVAARASKPQCTQWLLQQPDIEAFSKANHEGYTPLEALEAQLENQRVRTPFGNNRMNLLSDKFDGFDKPSVTCLLLLRGVEEPSSEQRRRARFGCSCGNCIEGFLSPRMLKNVTQVAEMEYDMLRSCCPPGEQWYRMHQDILHHLSSSLRSRFKTSKVLQKSFASVMSAVADCLSKGIIPRKQFVVEQLQSTWGWAEIESEYFGQGGTVAAVVGSIFDKAKLFDVEVGDPVIDTTPEEQYKGIPKCRNDLEFEFVRRHSVDDAAPEEDTNNKFL